MISISYPLSLSSYMAAFHTRPFFLLIKRHAQNTHSLVDPFQNDDLCADSYSGLNAGSELETNAIMGYYKYVSLRTVYNCRSLPGVVAEIDMHSFSQLILRPYGKYTDRAIYIILVTATPVLLCFHRLEERCNTR